MGCYDLITYLEYCQLTGTDPAAAETDEVRVCLAIEAVTVHLELACNCKFVQRQYTETHRPPPAPMPLPRLSLDLMPLPRTLVLHQQPVQSVVQIAELGGQVLTPTTYRLIPGLALIERQAGWPLPDGAYLVTVVGGWFPDTGSVAPNVKQAAAALTKEQYDNPAAAQSISSETVGPVSVTYGGGSTTTPMNQEGSFAALPGQVQTWLWPYVNVGGLGW